MSVVGAPDGEVSREGSGDFGKEGLLGRSFPSMAATQFLGAFNDSAFKQLILLVAVDLTAEGEAGTWQALATGLFALPFLLFSGLAGSLADRFSKTPIIRWAKGAEVVVMALGFLAFRERSMPFLLAALFLMGAQSAFFGPAKYGILPQMLPSRSLSRANGLVLMLTFLAIILGTGSAGWLKDHFGEDLQHAQIGCVLVAVIGVITALGVRRLPPAHPGLRIIDRPLGDLVPTLRSILRDRGFTLVVIANAYFWFLGSVVMQTMNRFGKKLMGLDDAGTARLTVTLSVGIAIGSFLGGVVSTRRVDFRTSSVGLCGVTVALLVLAWTHTSPWLTHAVLLALGVSGGMFTLPLQTYVQMWPPDAEKGRVVAATNFVSWIFICASAAYYWLATSLLPTEHLPTSLAILSALLGWALVPRLRRLARRLAREREDAADDGPSA